MPRSRRMPHFTGGALERSLAEAGVGYVHLPELGGFREPAPASPNGGWREPAFQGYADHMEGAEFAAGLARLTELAAARTTAAMCAEGQWQRCHRRLLSDALVVRKWRVVHVGPDGSRAEHELTPFATVGPDGRLAYPPEQGSLAV